MEVAELVNPSKLLGNYVELRGLLICDSKHCWLEDENNEKASRVILEKDDLFGIVGRQVSVLVGGRYPIFYPAKVRGVLTLSCLSEADYALRELSAIVVTTSTGEVVLDLSDGAGKYDLLFD